MSGMGDGYVGTAQDAVRIRRLEKQREVERRKIQDLKNKSASSKGQPGLLQFGSGTSEVFFFSIFKGFPFLCSPKRYAPGNLGLSFLVLNYEN